MTTQSDFERARREFEYRQAFLDGLDLGDLRERTCGIYYIGEGSTPNQFTVLAPLLYRQHTFAATTRPAEQRSAIIITNIAFVTPDIESVDDMLSILYDHEGTHVHQYRDAPYQEDITRTQAFIDARRVIPSDNGKYVIVDVKERYKKEERCLDLMDYTMTALNEIPALSAQHNGKYSSGISATMRKWTSENLDTLEEVLNMIDERADNATRDIFTNPLACFEKLLYSPHHTFEEVDAFLRRWEMKRAKSVPR